jgi:hypothetical protein
LLFPTLSTKHFFCHALVVSLFTEKMDQSLDEVSGTRLDTFFWSLNLFFQVIASTRTKHQRRPGRRTPAKTQVLGNPANAASRAAVQNAAAAKVVAAGTPASQSADKIIVSNLPPDVNEVQIKVLQLSSCP